MEHGSAELGGFLRARRAQVRPSDVGLPIGVGKRRTPGLRREELAALAGVSIDYLTRLEQGSETNPSSAVLDALANALLLDVDAHTYLYALANRAAHRTPPARSNSTAEDTDGVRPAVKYLLARLRPSPAYVLNQISDVLAVNPEGIALYAGLDRWPRPQWNTIRYVFLHPLAREVLANWEDSATTAVANLRAAQATPVAAAQPAQHLIEELRASSQDFRRLWTRYDVRPRRSHPTTFHHPTVGTLTLYHEVLYLSDEGLRLVVEEAEPGSPGDSALKALSLSIRRTRFAKLPEHDVM